MEGHLTIMAGDWFSGGYSFKFKDGSHIATNFTVTSRVTLAVTCPKGGGPGGTIVVDLGAKTYSVPAADTNWLPTGDANSVLSWMGSIQAPDLCNGDVCVLVRHLPGRNQEEGHRHSTNEHDDGGPDERRKKRWGSWRRSGQIMRSVEVPLKS